MNKAFVKEPEDYGDRCPACGSVGVQVTQRTLAAMLKPDCDMDGLSQSPCFCPLPSCEVAYFDGFERSVAVTNLKQPVYPKSETAPICPCFGLMSDAVATAAETGDVDEIKSHIQRAASHEACCEERSPTGTSCVANIQKLFMRLHSRAT